MRDINLFEGIKKSAPQKKGTHSVSFGLVLLILCVVVLGGLYGFLKYTESGLDSQISAASQSISTLQAGTAGKGDTTAKQSQISAIAAYNTMLESFQKDLQGYPKLNLALLNDISKRMPSDITVESLKYQKGVILLSGSGVNTDSPANFAAALKSSPYIDSVLFQGSNYQPPASGVAAGTYHYSMSCKLKGGAIQ